MPTFEEIRKELFEKHIYLSQRYGRQIPSKYLSFTASEYISAIGLARQEARTNQDLNNIAVADLFWKDFVDTRSGEYEMTKSLDRLFANSSTS